MSSGLNVDEIRAAGNDLLADLSEHVADPAGVSRVLSEWLADVGGRELGLISTAALLRVFGACLRFHHEPTVPPGAVSYARPERTDQ